MAGVQERVAVGVILGGHGLKGWLRVKSFTEDPAGMLDLGQLVDAQGRPLALALAGQHKGHLLVTLDTVRDRTAADALKGTQLFATRAAVAAAEPIAEDEDEGVLMDDLPGLEVRAADGTVLGLIFKVYNFGANDVIEVRLKNGQLEMWPFTHRTFPELYVDQGYVVADPPVFVGDPEPGQGAPSPANDQDPSAP